MAREKHITSLKIGNFKRFVDFEVKNLGQFNLIVGDNNTGKTSFLEALLFDEHLFKTLGHLYYSLVARMQLAIDNELKSIKNTLFDEFNIFLNRANAIIQELQISFFTLEKETKLSLKKLDDEKDIEKLTGLEREKFLSLSVTNEFIFLVNDYISTTLQAAQPYIKGYLPFISFGTGYGWDLMDFYTKYIDNNVNSRKLFIQNLKVFIPKVNDVRVGNSINIYEEGMDTPMPLYTYGEGANKLFRILCEIAMNTGKRLMIDEIDAGVHYSRFKQFWRTVLQAANAYDVQIFATTHNVECMDYFRDVLAEEAMAAYQEHARVVALKEIREGKVKARVYDYEQIEYAKEADHELRGSQL